MKNEYGRERLERLDDLTAAVSWYGRNKGAERKETRDRKKKKE